MFLSFERLKLINVKLPDVTHKILINVKMVIAFIILRLANLNSSVENSGNTLQRKLIRCGLTVTS